MNKVIEALAEAYPLLYLDPDADTQEAYRRVVLQGADPGKRSLAHYAGSAYDRDETVETPAGPVRTVTLGDRHDFTLVMRAMMAAKAGPLTPIPDSTGAAMLTVFNWPRIRAHLADFPEEEQAAELRRLFCSRAARTAMSPLRRRASARPNGSRIPTPSAGIMS